MSAVIAVIGGTGLCDWVGAEALASLTPQTPYGAPSAALRRLRFGGAEFLFLARHGDEHGVPPHRVNYRANLWALRESGARSVLAVNAVGGIGERYGAGAIVLPDQIIDYTYGRDHTFFDGGDSGVEHIDFTEPYSASLRSALADSARACQLLLVEEGVYGATQGPRLETAAEVRRMARDGCDVIGMTGMPEAALARELGLEYASLCLVVNPAAGLAPGVITMDDIQAVIDSGMEQVKQLLADCVVKLAVAGRKPDA